jgi:hypothetical protein
MTLQEHAKKISDIHIPLKHIISAIIVLLIICYFFKEKPLFEDLLKLLVPFLIGTSVKITSYIFKSLV